MTTSTTEREDLAWNSEIQVENSNSLKSKSINMQHNVDEIKKKDEMQSDEKNGKDSVIYQFSPTIDSQLSTNEEIIDGFSFLSFQSELDFETEFKKRKKEYFTNKSYQNLPSILKKTDNSASIIKQQLNNNDILCSPFVSSTSASNSITKQIPSDKMSSKIKVTYDQIIYKNISTNQRTIFEEESFEETNFNSENKPNLNDNIKLSSYSLCDDGKEMATKEYSSTFSTMSYHNEFQIHDDNQNLMLQSNLEKSEPNQKISLTKKFKTNEQNNLQQNLNDNFGETSLNRESNINNNNVIAESSGIHNVNQSSTPSGENCLVNQSNKANRSFNSSLQPFFCMPYTSSQTNQTTCTNFSKTYDSNKNKTNSFELFLSNKLLLDKQLSELSSNTTNPFEYMNKLMEFFQVQQNVLSASSKNTTNNNNNNSASPGITNNSAEIKLAKTLPSQNSSFPTSTSNINNNIHKHQLILNTTSSSHIRGFGTLPNTLEQSSSSNSNSNLNDSNQEENYFLPSLKNKDSLNHQYWTPSSIGHKPNTNCYSEYNNSTNQVHSSSNLVNKVKSTSFSARSEYHSGSPPPFTPLLLSQHHQQQSILIPPLNTDLFNQQKHSNLSSKSSNILIPTFTNTFPSYSSNPISNGSSISPHCINQQHPGLPRTVKTPKVSSTFSISSQLSNQNEQTLNSIETPNFFNQHNTSPEQFLTNSSLISSSKNIQHPKHFPNHHKNQHFLSSPSNLSSFSKANLNSSVSSNNSNNYLMNRSLSSSIENQFTAQNLNLLENKNSPNKKDFLSSNVNKPKNSIDISNSNQSTINSDCSKSRADMFGSYNHLTSLTDLGPLGSLAAAAATNNLSPSSTMLPTISSFNALSSLIPPLPVPPSLTGSSHFPFNLNTEQTSSRFNPTDLLRRELDSRFLQNPFNSHSTIQQPTSTSSRSMVPSQPNYLSLHGAKSTTSDMKHFSTYEQSLISVDQFLKKFPGMPFPPSFLPSSLPISPLQTQLELNSTQSSFVANNHKNLEKQTNLEKLPSQHTPPTFLPFSNNNNSTSLHKLTLSTTSSNFTNSHQKTQFSNRISKGKWCTAHIKIAHMIMMHKKQLNQQQHSVHSIFSPYLNQSHHHSSLSNKLTANISSHPRNQPVQPSFNKTTASTFHPPVQSLFNSTSFTGFSNLSNETAKANNMTSLKLLPNSNQISSHNRDKKSHHHLPLLSNPIGSSHNNNPKRYSHSARTTEHDKSIKANNGVNNRSNIMKTRSRSRSRSRSPLNPSNSNLNHHNTEFIDNSLHHSQLFNSDISKTNESLLLQSNISKSEKTAEMSPQNLVTEAAITAVAHHQLFLDRYKHDVMRSMSQSLPPLFTGLGSAVSSSPLSRSDIPLLTTTSAIIPGQTSINSNVLPYFLLNMPSLNQITSPSILLSNPGATTSSSPLKKNELSQKPSSKQSSNFNESSCGKSQHDPFFDPSCNLSVSQSKLSSLPSFLQKFFENMTPKLTESKRDSPNICESEDESNKLKTTSINLEIKKENQNQLPQEKSEKVLENMYQDQDNNNEMIKKQDDNDENNLNLKEFITENNGNQVENVIRQEKAIIMTDIDSDERTKPDNDKHTKNAILEIEESNRILNISEQVTDIEKQQPGEIVENCLNKHELIKTHEYYTSNQIKNSQIDQTLEINEQKKQEANNKSKELDGETIQNDESILNSINSIN